MIYRQFGWTGSRQFQRTSCSLHTGNIKTEVWFDLSQSYTVTRKDNKSANTVLRNRTFYKFQEITEDAKRIKKHISNFALFADGSDLSQRHIIFCRQLSIFPVYCFVTLHEPTYFIVIERITDYQSFENPIRITWNPNIDQTSRYILFNRKIYRSSFANEYL